ncbi:MAG: NUDIX domain-containing protein [Candidatus Nomurabacteria bacterium]|nr:NUDIX domain-containing protein [Candidatus Nomurabacteria bacterium]
MNKKFLEPDVTVDVVLFMVEDGVLKVLLVEREHEPYKGIHALPGGYLFEKETARTGAERVLEEKAGVKNIYIEQLYTFDTPGRDPRGPNFSISYIALVHSPIMINKSHDVQKPEWFPVKKLPKLGFDHKEIIEYAVERLRGKLEYTTIGFNALPKLFTLSQLQQVYEVILNKKLDKRNFRKKMDQFGFIKETNKSLTGMRQRPAKLYSLAVKPGEIKNF